MSEMTTPLQWHSTRIALKELCPWDSNPRYSGLLARIKR